jgi:long-chain-alcohol oxidase
VGRTADGHRLTVNARAVIASCGAIHTPALLRRSGLQNDNIGRHLKLHPAGAVFGVYDEELKPWEGVMQALYSDQFRDLDDGYGLKFETAASHPHLLIPFSPWRSAGQHLELLEGLTNTVPIGVLLRDRDGGEVRVDGDGHPVVRYRLSDFDAGHLRTGMDGAAQLLEASGARRIFSSHSKWVSYNPGRSGSRGQFMADADAAGYGSGQVSLNSFHIMGSARMGGSPTMSACTPLAVNVRLVAPGARWDTRCPTPFASPAGGDGCVRPGPRPRRRASDRCDPRSAGGRTTARPARPCALSPRRAPTGARHAQVRRSAGRGRG